MADIAPSHILWKYIQENVVCFGIGNEESQAHGTYEEGFLILLVTNHIASYIILVLRCSIVRKDKQGGYNVGGKIYIVSKMKKGILYWPEPNGFPIFLISMLERRLGC
jgi:hypothetical protein